MLQQKPLALLHSFLAAKNSIGRFFPILIVTFFTISCTTNISTTAYPKKNTLITATPIQTMTSSLQHIYMLSQKDWSTDYISKLDATTKKQEWMRELRAINGPLVVGKDTIYAIASDADKTGKEKDYLYALDAATGATRWRADLTPGDLSNTNNTPFPGTLSIPVEENGIVYTSSRNGKLYALNSITGTQMWNYAIQTVVSVNGTAPNPNTPVAIADAVYETTQNVLYALSASTGKLRWSQQINPSFTFNDATIVNVVLYTSASETHPLHGNTPTQGYVYAFNIADGSQIVFDFDHYRLFRRAGVLAPAALALLFL